MTSYKILVLPGDGIGPEVVREGIKVLEAIGSRFNLAFELTYGKIGGEAIDAHGVPLPPETLEQAKAADAVLMGSVGHPKYDTLDPAIRPEQGLLQIRKGLNLFANIRPVKLFPPLAFASTLKPEVVSGIDLVVVRELTGGIYFGEPRRQTDTDAVDSMTYTRQEIERIARVGFELAQKRQKRLTSVDKANVLACSRLWRQVVTELARDYPDVTLDHMYVDNAAMQLILNPRQFDVLLTENMFGDILSDEASMLTGSLGMLSSASMGEMADTKNALYEPSHGSAPDIAGQNKANPLATIQSVALMLDYSFQESEAAQCMMDAVASVLAAGLRTADLAVGDTGAHVVTTQAMGNAVAQAILSSQPSSVV